MPRLAPLILAFGIAILGSAGLAQNEQASLQAQLQAQAAVLPPPPPAQAPVRFSIADSPTVIEGGELSFKITRQGDDGQPHRVFLSYPDESKPFLVERPEFIDFPIDRTEQTLLLRTVADPAANGQRTIEVQLSEAQGGQIDQAARVARGAITDPPPPEQSSYSIGLEGDAVRGQQLAFLVTRIGPMPRAEIAYEIAQDGQTSPGRVPFIIEENESTAPLPLSAADYDPCGGPVQVSLDGVIGQAVATAELTGALPPQCIIAEPPPEQPWWPWVVGGIVLIVLGGGLWKLLHRPDRDISDDGFIDDGFVDPDPPPDEVDDRPDPPPPIIAECTIKAGAPRLSLSESSIGRWPRIETEVTFKRGIARIPDPLPVVEPDDG